jgi:hypothetical protein
MVSVFSPNTVNRGFIDGVIVNSLFASMVIRGLIFFLSLRSILLAKASLQVKVVCVPQS